MSELCFLFGHADCAEFMLPKIEDMIEHYYSKYRVTDFYVGNRGRFDSLAATAVIRAKQRHSDIRLYLLLAYHPGERAVNLSEGFDNAYYPPLEQVPRQYAILRANQHMVDIADFIICYVKHIGNARNLLDYAKRRRKGMIIENIAFADDD